MISFCRRLSDHPVFQNIILLLILVNAIVIGMETSQALMDRWGKLFTLLNGVFQAIFIAEIVVRMTACAPQVRNFFKNGWNVFDFIIVGLSLLPAIGPLSTVARIARLLRVTRLVTFSPELRLIIATMLKSISSIGHIAMLMGLFMYVYAVAGVHLFSKIDPEKWGDLGRAGLTLFEIITLEGWVDFQERVMGTLPYAWIFFVSFIVIAVFVMVNLLVAVVINNLDTVKKEEAR